MVRPNDPRDELSGLMTDNGQAEPVNFFGERGIIKLGKKALLDEAKKLHAADLAKGATGAEARDRVYRDTGFYTQRGPAGAAPSLQWKMETPSFQARLKGDALEEFKPQTFDTVQRPLEDILDYDALFAGDPELARLRATLNFRPPGTRTTGGYNYTLDSGSTGYARPAQNFNDPITVTAGSREDLMNTLLHEIQHRIQHMEGFPEGWSTRGGFGDVAGEQFGKMQDIAKRRLGEVLQSGPPPDDPNWLEWQLRPETQRLLGGYGSVANPPSNADRNFFGYRLSAGETEANNAANRAKIFSLLTPDEAAAAQRLSAPWTTQDYPEDVTWRRRFASNAGGK